MFTLALLLALSGKPTFVCVGFTAVPCDYTYSSLAQAEAEAPGQTFILTMADDKITVAMTTAKTTEEAAIMNQQLWMWQLQQMQDQVAGNTKLLYPVSPPREVPPLPLFESDAQPGVVYGIPEPPRDSPPSKNLSSETFRKL
jgi:hypothetical protein